MGPLFDVKNIIRYSFFVAIFVCVSCQGLQQVAPQTTIVGNYVYEHSWDYASPDGVGIMHCNETGTIDFQSDGTYVDKAIQHHYHIFPDTSRVHYPMSYYCEGEWKVEDGKFLFNEHSENFSLKLVESVSNQELADFASMIVLHNTPNSKQWFTFAIDRLDQAWFVWSYTDKSGHKTTWDMQRVR